jgi:glycerophosphoryl diester phosphodiesterase
VTATKKRIAPWGLLGLAALATAVSGCSDAGVASQPPVEVVRGRIGHALPENSIPSFLQAMADGADGIELDVELTSDGGLLIMHDDTLDRTTTCSGCVSAYTVAEAQACFLLDGDGRVTDLHPPTLAEVFEALPEDALVNIELKVYDEDCTTPTTGAAALAEATVAEVEMLEVANRVLFSSFDETAATTVKVENPGLYSAYLVSIEGTQDWQASIDLTASLGLDALHPLFIIPAEGVQLARASGLQLNVWTVNNPVSMVDSIDKGVTAIITDEPAILAEILAERR